MEFAHKTVGEYFAAVKLYEDYFMHVFNELDEYNLKEFPIEIIRKVWRSIFNSFRYSKIPADMMNYLVELIKSKQSADWKSRFFQSYYKGLEEQLLVTSSYNEAEYLGTYAALLSQISLAFRNLTWLLTGLGFNNQEFNNTKKNLEILASYIEDDVNLSGWKNLEGINLSHKDLWDANFSGSCLDGANFNSSFLFDAKFNNSMLRGSDFSDAQLANSQFEQAHLEDANLQRTNLFEADLRNARLNRATIWGADFQSAQLQETNFKDAQLQYAVLEDADIKNANFDGAHLEKTCFENACLVYNPETNRMEIEEEYF